MLIELLKNNIQHVNQVNSWKEAILLSANPLLQNNSITSTYTDAMIDMCEKFKGYIVLNDYFAMPHATSTFGVNKLSISLLILKESVDFFGKPVHLVLTLAPIDNHSHLQLLQEVALYFSEVDVILEIAKTTSTEDVFEILKRKGR